MYANFYYQKSTKKYGRGRWLYDFEMEDSLEFNSDFIWIGTVRDQDLFKNSELKPNAK